MYPVTVSNWDLWRLYHKVTFDGANRIIYVNDGVTSLNIKNDVYSDWKEWVASYSDNAVWPPAIRTIGGDPTVGIERAGDIYFLINGWKLYIDLTKVRVIGTLFSDDFDSAYYDYSGTIQYPVQVTSTVSTVETAAAVSASNIWDYSSRTLTQEIAADAPTTEEIATAVWGYITRTLTQSAGTTPQEVWEYANRSLTSSGNESIASSVWSADYSSFNQDGTMGHLLNYTKNLSKTIWLNTTLAENGNGSQEYPFNNLASAITKAELDNIRNLIVTGNLTLTRELRDFNVLGVGRPQINLNNQNISNSVFDGVFLTGDYTGGNSITIRNSLLLPGFFLDGYIENTGLVGQINCKQSPSILLKDCFSGGSGFSSPNINMSAGQIISLIIVGYSGELTISNCTDDLDNIVVEMSSGSLTFDSSCTSGTLTARGVGNFTNNTLGGTVINEMVNQDTVGRIAEVGLIESKVLELWELMGLDPLNTKTITDTSITVGGITLNISQPDDNTTEVTRS